MVKEIWEGVPVRLKPRLAALAGLIPPGDVVADIGTDHAYLPLYLAGRGLVEKVIAIDNRPAALERARRLIKRDGTGAKIELRLGDGLDPVKPEDKVETVVIAGLGGRTICRLLAAARDKWDWFGSMVFQPMQEAPLLRRWLAAHDMRLVSERLVREGRKIYEIMLVRRGRQRIYEPLLYELGPCLLRDRDPLLEPLIEQKIRRCRSIIEALERSKRPESKMKQAYFAQKEARLKEVLAFVAGSKGDR